MPPWRGAGLGVAFFFFFCQGNSGHFFRRAPVRPFSWIHGMHRSPPDGKRSPFPVVPPSGQRASEPGRTRHHRSGDFQPGDGRGGFGMSLRKGSLKAKHGALRRQSVRYKRANLLAPDFSGAVCPRDSCHELDSPSFSEQIAGKEILPVWISWTRTLYHLLRLKCGPAVRWHDG